jgi:Transglutaminase-like superfamily
MRTAKYIFLILKALFEMTRYDVIVSLLGVGRILRHLRRQRISMKPCTEELQRTICDAVLLATCFYWKPVLCLQRSVCTVRLLRKYGIDARLVIGYRPSPFFSHAWVEVNGRVVYGSAAYQQRLQTLVTA